MTASAHAVPVLKLRRPGAGRILARSIGYLRPYWARILGAYLFLLLNNGIALAIPLIMRDIIDQGIRIGDLVVIYRGTGLLLVIGLLRGLSVFLTGRWAEIASQNVAYDLRNKIHNKLMSFSFSYHDEARTGQLLARAVSDVDRVRFLTGRAILRIVEVTTLILGIAISMLRLNLHLALLTLVVVPLLAYAALNFGRRYRPLSAQIQQQLANLTARLEQNLRGARVVKAFAAEEAEIQRFEQENRALFGFNLTASRMRSIFEPFMSLVAGLGTVGILVYGGQLVIRNQLTLGELVAFTAYISQLVVPVRRLGVITSGIVQALASAERVFEILDTETEVRDQPGAKPMGPVRGHVCFENVSFAYFGRHWALRQVDFTAEPGTVTAILGATGSGKSTLVNLVPRFYDPTHGRILIDGRDIRSVTLDSLRRQIGIVFQDAGLFATTIRENIAFGRPGASDGEIIAAAKAAAAHEFIMTLPQQYETRVGERGVTLSGGQKQRLAIARALLKNPRILILDDATSSVDSETEALIQEALARLMEGRTAFVIAQRLSTVRKADQILVLDHGRIAAAAQRTPERSAHEELLRTSGLYAEIYYRQLRPQELQRTEGEPS